MYKSDNRLLRYQTISNYKFHWLLVSLAIISETTRQIHKIKLILKSAYQTVFDNISYIT